MQGTAHVTFDDEFNSLSLWNGTSGTWETTFWYEDPLSSNGGTLAGNGEQEWYINSNYGPTSSVKPWTVANGVLTLTAAPATSTISSLINGYSYTSGEINSYHSFSQTYGYFEMRAQLPSGQGFWPAFWLMPENGAWPPELDIMEVLGNNTSVLYNTVHSAIGGHTITGDGGVTVADMSTGYHTYGVDWEPDYITFYFDGQEVYQTATPADMNSPMYIIANLAAGGYWPGSVNAGSVGKMNIDYIRAYASGAAAGATSTGAATSTSTPGASSASTTAASTPAASSSTSSNASGGQTFTSDNNGDHWTGTSGADTFNLGRGGDVVSGNGGNDTFKFSEVPWTGGHITDFNAGDVLDLSGMFSRYGYSGSNPLSDGHLKFVSNGAGGTQVWFDMDGLSAGSGTWLVTTLDNVSPSSLSIANGLITEGAAASSAAGASSTSTPASSTSASSSSTSSAPASTGGKTFTSDNNGDHWTGTAGNDTFNLGRGGDVVTGNGGNDTFKFSEAPWAGGHITDFNAGDVLDVSAMLQRYGLDSSHIKMVSDGSDGTQVWFDAGSSGNWLLDTLDHVAPSTVSISSSGLITEGGSSSSAGGGSASSTSPSTSSSSTTAGKTFTSDNSGDHWTGTAGNDTFNLGRGGDVVTGAGGNDTFVQHETPWTAGHITDFSSGDTLDLSGMLATDGYKSGDAVAQGYLKVTADSAGEAQIWSHLSGQWWLADTLDHVAPSSLHINGAFITG
ncbi:MAG TPA: family 16 glycosylhydrolase [Caulobacteraceae bacterium]